MPTDPPNAVSEPLSLSVGQQFELERMSRAIDATHDPQTLQRLAKQLLQAWQSQKAATQWLMRQQLAGQGAISPDGRRWPGPPEPPAAAAARHRD